MPCGQLSFARIWQGSFNALVCARYLEGVVRCAKFADPNTETVVVGLSCEAQSVGVRCREVLRFPVGGCAFVEVPEL